MFDRGCYPTCRPGTKRARRLPTRTASDRRGFTLIELLITVALVAILATLAFPSFQHQIREARRADGQTALLSLAIAEEKYRASCPQYASQVGGSRGCTSGAAPSHALGLSEASRDGRYRLSLDNVSATGFRAIATPVGDQALDQSGGVSCNPISLDQDGHREPRECW